MIMVLIWISSINNPKFDIEALKKELMDSRFALATSQIEDTSIFKKIKKEIAQANTILNQKLHQEKMKEEANE